MIQTFGNGTIEWFVDPIRRVLFSRWSGDFMGEDLLTALPAFWDPHPEAAQYGSVHDQLDYTGLIEHTHSRELMRMRVARFGEEQAGIRTAVVTGNPMKTFELKVTRVVAPEGRQFRMFGSNAAALDWVTADEPGNPSAARVRSDAQLPWWYHRTAARIDAG